jgi:hypothetical protein
MIRLLLTLLLLPLCTLAACKERHAAPSFIDDRPGLLTAALNQWFFRDRNHPWMFAFADWEFDGNGFPRPGPR